MAFAGDLAIAINPILNLPIEPNGGKNHPAATDSVGKIKSGIQMQKGLARLTTSEAFLVLLHRSRRDGEALRA